MTGDSGYAKEPEGTGLIKAHKENIIDKSLDKFKETTRVCMNIIYLFEYSLVEKRFMVQ